MNELELLQEDYQYLQLENLKLREQINKLQSAYEDAADTCTKLLIENNHRYYQIAEIEENLECLLDKVRNWRKQK